MKPFGHNSYALFAALLLLTLSGCARESRVAASAPQIVRDVSLVRVEKQQVQDSFEAVGTVQASQSSVVSSRTMARIDSVRVHEGSIVRRGDLLVLLDEAQSAAELKRAEAALAASNQNLVAAQSDADLARSTLERYRQLYEKKSLAPQEFDEAKARERAASARVALAAAQTRQAGAALQQARVNSDFTRIRAPFDGVVVSKQAEVGAMASPGSSLLVLEGKDKFRVDAVVNENDLSAIKLNQPVRVTVGSEAGREIAGKVSRIVPAADVSSRTFVVKVELPTSSGFRSGMFARVRFPRGSTEILALPPQAVVRQGVLNGVFLLDQDRIAHLRLVTLGKQFSPLQVQVLSGLAAGDTVVLEAQDRDLEGKRIEARQ